MPIDKRFSQLDKLSAQVNAAVRVTQAEKDALQGSIGATRSGLTTLRATIATDSRRARGAEPCFGSAPRAC